MSWSDRKRSYEQASELTVEEAMAEAGIDENHPCFGCELVRRVCGQARNDAQEAWSYHEFSERAELEPSRATNTDWAAYYARASQIKAQASQDKLVRAADLTGHCVEAENSEEELGGAIGKTACRMVARFGSRNPKVFAYNVVHGPMPSLTEK